MANPFAYLWSRWARNADWRDRLHKKASYKSLDIPEEDVIEANKVQVGIGPLGAVGIALAAGLPVAALALLAGWFLLGKEHTVTQEVKPPVDSAYEVLFYDKDGKPIKVPHISERRP